MKRWFRTVKREAMGRCAALWLLILAVLLAAGGCNWWEDTRRENLFDEPTAIITLTDLAWVGAPGGTLIYGDARNEGGLTAENVKAVITAKNGNSVLGTITTEVSMGFDEETGEVIATLEPGDQGSFGVTVPLSPGQITSVTVTFTWTPPFEEPSA